MSTPTIELQEVVERLQDGPFGSNLKSSHYTDEGVRVVRLQNVGVGTFKDDDEAFISVEHFSALKKHECRPGDILVATLGDPIIRAATLPETVPVALNKADCIQVRCDRSKIVPQYLVHFLNSRRAQSQAVAFSHGQTRPRVNLGQLRRFPIPLPPIEEQRRIAAVLDAADALRAKRRQALAKLDSLTQAIFIDMFGDPVGNGRGWPVSELGSVCERIQIGPFGSKLHQSDYVTGGIPLVNPMHIVDGAIEPDESQSVATEKYGELESYLLRVGDVVMGRRGEMGRVAIVRKHAAGYVCGSGSLFMRPDPERLRPSYLAAVLSSSQGRRRLEQSAQGVTMPNLNASIVESFSLAVPPLEFQVDFETALASQRRLADSADEHMRAFDRLFASLQQRAFRGEL